MKLWAGLSAVLIAGLLQGMYALPMKFLAGWGYENIWLVFSMWGMIVLPWCLAAFAVPHLAQIYSSTSAATLAQIAGFGFCWGVGCAMSGVGMMLVGIGLGMAIILGVSASLGSLIPLLILTPNRISTPQGHLYLIGTAIMIAGIALCAKAGILRDAIRTNEEIRNHKSFMPGFMVCCLSGIFSSALNFSYAFGGEASQRAFSLGASRAWSPSVVTALAVSGGFCANFAYCTYLLRRNHTANRFAGEGAGRGWVAGFLMGALWFGGQSLYALGVSHMGEFGVVIGWPLLMGMIIVTSNAAGLLTGEWRGVSALTRRYLAGGMVVLLVALSVLAMAQNHI
jgi:L-rhamnose-H+ transport protein